MAERVLFIGSGSPDHLRRALDRFAQVWPHVQVDLAVRPEALEVLSEAEQQRVVYVAGRKQGRLAFIRACRARKYHRVVVLFAGDPGFNALKLAAFLCGNRWLCFNENGDAFALDRQHWRQARDHVRWRLRLAHRGLATLLAALGRAVATSLLRAALAPCGLFLLTCETGYVITRAAFLRRERRWVPAGPQLGTLGAAAERSSHGGLGP